VFAVTIRFNPLVTHSCALLLRVVVFGVALGPAGALAFRSTLYPTNWTSPTVASANLETDKLIQDFSYAGYRAGEQPIPNVVAPIFNVTMPPYGADSTGVTNATVAIQSAINAAQSAGGGVVFLPTGLYSVSPQGANSYALQINAANVVLRGAGPNATFLLNTSTNMRSKSIILMTGPSAAGFYSSGAASTAISQDLPGPTREIPVTSTSGFATGQWVVVRADCTDAWITEHGEPDWIGYGSNLRGVAYFRRVVSVSAISNTITINAPTRYYLKIRDNARVVRLSSAPLLNCGLENFSIGNLQHHGPGWGEDDYTVVGTGAYEVHDSFAIRIVRARDCWMRNLATFQPASNTNTAHLLSNGILINECSQLTLTNVSFARTQYGGGGGNGYLYRLQNANDCLLDNCRATFTRHGFVLSHMASSGNVYHGCTEQDTGRQTGDTGSQSTSGANSDHHMHFSHANLVDACTADGSGFEARYRPYGSAPLHNLTAAHSVFWNTRGIGSGPSYAVQSEQSRYGYVIGTRGTRTGVSLSTYGGTKCNPADHVEGMAQGDSLEPFSLYEDQLKRRLGLPAVSLPAVVHLGFPTNSVRLQPLVQIGSETASTNQYSALWTVISAPGQVIFSSSNSPNPLVTFGDRGTNEVEITVTTTNNQQTSTRCRVILLPHLSLSTESFTPVADTFVRDGTFANDNYGEDTALLLKKNATIGYTRYTYLRFDFSAATLTNFNQAFLELRTPTPPSTETAPTFELHFVANDGWSETNTTWNTQPAMGATLTTWVMSTSGVDRVEVTGIVASEISGDRLLSFGLLIANPFSDTVYAFGSREGTASRRPQLLLEAGDPVSFTDWINGFTNLPPADAGPASNPDGDRLNNAEEFLFVQHPSVAETSPAFSIVPAASGFHLTFTQRKNLAPEIYYVIETSLSLSPALWKPAAGVEFSQVGNTDEAILMNAFVPTGMSQGFYRFRIVLGT
jgi:hypothetical protein